MPEDVFDGLEAVEVDDTDDHGGRIGIFRQVALDEIEEAAAIGQQGERVNHRQPGLFDRQLHRFGRSLVGPQPRPDFPLDDPPDETGEADGGEGRVVSKFEFYGSP